MRSSVVLVAGFLVIAAFATDDDRLLGFSEGASERQRALEEQYDGLLNRDHLRTWMKRMTALPQHVGSPHARENVEFMAELFRSWGYEVEIETFHVLFPTPKVRRLELLEPHAFTASLMEPDVEGDATSTIRANRLPPYNAYSADGDVKAELVYVNQGIPRDYEVLERAGIDVEGKIVIARYGGSWRGIKPKIAAERGAVACILYSDPRDDGYFQGDVYPEGPYRMEHGVQLGSVLDMPVYPGDPLTPGRGATLDAERLSREEASTLMRIPVLPISYGDATALLQALGGPVAPPSWRGALPFTYHIGPGPARVHVKLEFDWDLAPAFNVIARMQGSQYPDEWIVRGNHRDGWVFGAADPISGMVALMEEARAVGELARQGFKPRRTLVYAGWGAEEPGLLGSTEWVEEHADVLREKAVAYINSDGNGRGFLRAGGSHTLERLVNEVARSVADPQWEGITVAERARARRRVSGDTEADTRTDLRISPLGSGSDYSPFLQHLGIASLHIGFGGENGGGSYHSAFDSYDHYVRFGDPTFDYGVALAKVAGRLTLRLANADILPLSMSNYADNVGRYVDEVQKLAETVRQETERHNSLVAAGAYLAASDPTKRYVAPKAKASVPHLNFAPLKNAFARLEKSAHAYDKVLPTVLEQAEDAQVSAVNEILLSLERSMTRTEGLPRRPWYKHHIYAPGLYTGYGVKTLPGVREAIEQHDWEEASGQIVLAAEVLERVAAEIDRATNLLPRANTSE